MRLPMMTRRDVLRTAAAASIATLKTASANPLGLPIGCQTYPVRRMIGRDFPGTLKQLHAAGFEAIEMCSPVGYSDSGFGTLGKFSGTELKGMIADIGLKCESSHFDINELRKDLPGRIAWAKEMGLTQMMVPSLDGPKHPTMDDVKRAADEYNKIAEQTAAAGMQQGLHNEDFELAMVDGKRVYDLLFDLLDPKLVKMQFQVSTISAGLHAADYFDKYPGRFISMHAQGWDAKTGGIKNYFVEMDLPLMRESVPYLKSLNV